MIEAASLARIQAVVVGASAGGIEALLEVLPGFRRGCGVAAFVVLHLPRDQPSQLVSIFSRKCEFDVREAEDKEPVCADTIYFAPPDYHVLIDEGSRIALSSDDPVNFSRPSIDVLFESAADFYQERVMGIILSGASDDGAAGLHAVRAAGGLAVVQRPDTAPAPFMAESALRRTAVDGVMTLDEIAASLRTLRAYA